MTGQADQLVVDGADRMVAGLYTVGAAGLSAACALAAQPGVLGPWPWWWPAAAGTGFAALSVVTPLARKVRGAAAVRATCWLSSGSWVAYACVEGVGRTGYWLAGACGAGLLGMASAIWATPTDLGQPMHPNTPAAPGIPQPPPNDQDELAGIITAATKGRIVGVTTDWIDEWAGDTGWTAHLTMPGDGSTWETLQPYQAAIASVLNLPKGGGVTACPDMERGARAAQLRVLHVDGMADPAAYPGLDDYEDY